MRSPAWARWLVRRFADPEWADDVVGDLEETHVRLLERRGRIAAHARTALDAVGIALAFGMLRRGPDSRGINPMEAMRAD